MLSFAKVDGSDGDRQYLEVDVLHVSKPTRVKHSSKILTRLQAVQQLFFAFINRCEAYDHAHRIALMLFNNEVELACDFTGTYEVFREAVDDASPSGDTRLYDCLGRAADELIRFTDSLNAGSVPTAGTSDGNGDGDGSGGSVAKRRIICLSDGKDTKSTIKAHSVAKKIREAGIVCDSVSIGDDLDDILRGLVAATGGFAFNPSDLHDALRLNELETFQSLNARAETSLPPAKSVQTKTSLEQLASKTSYHDVDSTKGKIEPLLSVPVMSTAAIIRVSLTVY